MIIFPHNVRIIFEIDGRQHYSSKNSSDEWIANPKLYVEHTEHDRQLQLKGYRVLRYGIELFNRKEEVKRTLIKDFDELYNLYS